MLHGYIEEPDHLDAMNILACPACDSQFESVVLHLDALAFADSDGIEALANYCGELVGQGGSVLIETDRSALHRLLVSGPLAEFVGTDWTDESGPGEGYSCPHRWG